MQESVASRSLFLKMGLERDWGRDMGCFSTLPLPRVFYNEKTIIGNSLPTIGVGENAWHCFLNCEMLGSTFYIVMYIILGIINF